MLCRAPASLTRLPKWRKRLLPSVSGDVDACARRCHRVSGVANARQIGLRLRLMPARGRVGMGLRLQRWQRRKGRQGSLCHDRLTYRGRSIADRLLGRSPGARRIHLGSFSDSRVTALGSSRGKRHVETRGARRTKTLARRGAVNPYMTRQQSRIIASLGLVRLRQSVHI